jgi:hypothetical protein
MITSIRSPTESTSNDERKTAPDALRRALELLEKGG